MQSLLQAEMFRCWIREGYTVYSYSISSLINRSFHNITALLNSHYNHFDSGGSHPALLDKAKYPTVVSLTVIKISVMIDFMLMFLRSYDWTTIYMLCDSDISHNIGFYRVNCDGLRRRLWKDAFRVQDVFDSSVLNTTMNILLAVTASQEPCRLEVSCDVRILLYLTIARNDVRTCLQLS